MNLYIQKQVNSVKYIIQIKFNRSKYPHVKDEELAKRQNGIDSTKKILEDIMLWGKRPGELNS
jgi:hypothetical protein